MKKEVPKSLKSWFVIHFFVDYIFAIPLLINPIWFLSIFGWKVIDPLASRLVAAGLFSVGGVSLLERNSNLDVYKSLLNLKIILSSAALIGIFITMINGAPIFGWLIFGLYAIFCIVWVYYKIKLKKVF